MVSTSTERFAFINKLAIHDTEFPINPSHAGSASELASSSSF